MRTPCGESEPRFATAAASRQRAGFTIAELLSVVALIAVLAAILFPAFARAREQARAVSCLGNLVNIGLGLKMYATDHGGLLPPAEDDLGPLLPRYVPLAQCFECPSNAGNGLPMGCPGHEPRKGPEASPPAGRMGAFGGQPGAAGPGGMPAPPGGGPSGGGNLGRGSEDGAEGYAGLTTCYFYHSGQNLDHAPAVWLCSDHKPLHNGLANVLFTDGAVKKVPVASWFGMGLQTADKLMQRWAPPPPQSPWRGPGAPPGGGRDE